MLEMSKKEFTQFLEYLKSQVIYLIIMCSQNIDLGEHIPAFESLNKHKNFESLIEIEDQIDKLEIQPLEKEKVHQKFDRLKSKSKVTIKEDESSLYKNVIEPALQKHNEYRTLHHSQFLILNKNLSKHAQEHAENLAAIDSLINSDCIWED